MTRLDVDITIASGASLRGETGNQKFIATDTGCVWGYELTAIELETGKRFAVRKKENE